MSSVFRFRLPDEAPQVNIQMSFTTTNNMGARVSVGEGLAQGEPAVILDLTVGISEPVKPELDDLAGALDAAHTVIHDMFVGSTTSLRTVMQPENGDGNAE
jgi:uncharacterized protein (TIGR04255 family)